MPAPKSNEQAIRLSDLVTLVNQWKTIALERSKELDYIEIKLVEGPGRVIFVTRELIRAFTPQPEVLGG